jgi:hypothetical protein
MNLNYAVVNLFTGCFHPVKNLVSCVDSKTEFQELGSNDATYFSHSSSSTDSWSYGSYCESPSFPIHVCRTKTGFE